MHKAGEMAAPAPAAMLSRDNIMCKAVAVLEEHGLRNVTIPRVAERLGIDPALLRERFSGRRELIAGVSDHITRGIKTEIALGMGWQDLLRQRAIGARRAMLAHRDGALLLARAARDTLLRQGRSACLAGLRAQGFSDGSARAALAHVDRFTLGWTLVEQAESPDDLKRPDFSWQLEVALKGIAADRASDETGFPVDRHQIFLRHLWSVLRNARESANIVHARTAHLVELDQRIAMLLNSHGALSLLDISTSTGVDKAQVSRAVKRLEEQELVRRDGTRQPLHLTAQGHEITSRMMHLAELHNRELTFGISDEQLIDMFAVLEELMTRAMLLFEQERKLSANPRLEPPGDFPDLTTQGELGNGAMVVERSRVLPPFITLCSYMMRSAALSCKRLTGLSNFEAWVLAVIGSNPPTSWAHLTQSLYRDHSQAGRTVSRLIEIGLIERSGRPGRRHGVFAPTTEGARIYALIDELNVKRDEFILQNVDPVKLRNFLAGFGMIARNAEAQLARERAVQEMEITADPR